MQTASAARRLGLVQLHLAPLPASAKPFSSTPLASSDGPDPRDRPQFSFFTASAFHGKPTDPRDPPPDPRHAMPPSSPIRQWVEDVLARHPSSGGGKVRGGHDWFFAEPMKGRSGVALGVADGVGGWSEDGVDPGQVAQGIMYFARRTAKKYFASEDALPEEDSDGAVSTESGSSSSPSPPLPLPRPVRRRKDPRVAWPHDLLAHSWSAVLSNRDVHGGASTALISTLCSRSGILRYASLGDSQLVVLRRFNVVHSSRIQTHYFNCPYQLTKMPFNRWPKQGQIMDEPRQAGLGKWQCQDGDLVVLWTDGVGDNVFLRQVEEIAKLVMSDAPAEAKDGDPGVELSEERKVQKFALTLCYVARMMAHQVRQPTPFELEARSVGQDFTGGKVDDITVVAALCRER